MGQEKKDSALTLMPAFYASYQENPHKYADFYFSCCKTLFIKVSGWLCIAFRAASSSIPCYRVWSIPHFFLFCPTFQSTQLSISLSFLSFNQLSLYETKAHSQARQASKHYRKMTIGVRLSCDHLPAERAI